MDEGACRIGASAEECASQDKTLVDKNAKLKLPDSSERKPAEKPSSKKKVKVSREQDFPRP